LEIKGGKMKILKTYQSLNFSKRTKKIDTIIIHQTEGDFPGCAEWLCDPKSKASAHYLVNKNGDIYQLVEDNKVAWHAGKAEWDYNEDKIFTKEEHAINSRSLGIELVSKKGETTDIQLVASKLLVEEKMDEHKVKVKLVLGHKEIAPSRKTDPKFSMIDYRNSLD
jgi:N-acetylmuramoyl-L-alanine amidase